MAQLIQTASGSIGATFPGFVSAGNLILAVVSAPSLAGAQIRPSTNRTSINDHLADVGPVQGSGCALLIAYWHATQSGPLTIEISGAQGATVGIFELAARAFTSVPGGFGFLGSSTAVGSGASADPGPIALPTPPTADGPFVFSALAYATSATITPASGFTPGTSRDASAAATGLATEYAFTGIVNTPDATFGLSASQPFAVASLAFSENGLPGNYFSLNP